MIQKFQVGGYCEISFENSTDEQVIWPGEQTIVFNNLI